MVARSLVVYSALTVIPLFTPVLYGSDNDNGESAKLKILKTEISRLQKQLRKSDDARNLLATRLRETEVEAARIQQNLANLRRQINSLNGELGNLTGQKSNLEGKKQQQAKQVAREISAAYRLGQVESWKLLFNLENTDQVGRILKYYEYLVAARTAVLINYKNTLDEIASVEKAILDNQAKLSEEQEKLILSSNALVLELSERKELLSKINRQLIDEKSRLTKLQIERDQLSKIIAKLAENIANLSSPSEIPFANQRGKLPWPVQGQVTHTFGATRNAGLKWTGWLMAAKEATAVKVVHHGRIVFSDYLRGHGLMLIVDHGGGYLSLYAHNQMLLKEIGDWVASGEEIARVGNTGGRENSALYFEIRRHGEAVDPKIWLKTKA